MPKDIGDFNFEDLVREFQKPEADPEVVNATRIKFLTGIGRLRALEIPLTEEQVALMEQLRVSMGDEAVVGAIGIGESNAGSTKTT